MNVVLELVVIVSAPVPPRTIASPVPIVISSSPPTVGAVVPTRPTVIGSEPNGDGLPATPSISPESPTTIVEPEPPRATSPRWHAASRVAPGPGRGVGPASAAESQTTAP